MKIMHVIAPGPAGGAESAVRSLTLGLQKAGHQVEVVALTSDTVGDHPFVARLREDGIAVTDVRLGRRDYVGEAKELSKLLRQRKADVVHSHAYRADAVAFLASNFTGTPHVSTLHGYIVRDLKEAAYVKFDAWILRRCAAVICVAPNVRDEALASGTDKQRVHLVPNGYEAGAPFVRDVARTALDIPSSARVVGWVGRLSPEKGADLFLDAFAQMQTSGVQAVLIGDGPERANLEKHVQQLGLPPRSVHFAGRIDEAARLLPAFDALALSSRTEGMPMVILEAMAARVPVVAFGVGGVSCMLSSESALVVARNDVSAMSRALDYTFQCPRSAIARAGVANAVFRQRYSSDMCARRTADIYSRVVSRGPFAPTADVAPATRSPQRLQVASMYKQARM